jgi:peptidoglycan hydrolase-like protein with peptidoglycan-binding domain
MRILKDSIGDLTGFIREEVEYPGEIVKGKRGKSARRIQEWLCLNGHDVVPDGDFGDVTEVALKEFQGANGLHASGVVDGDTFRALVAPMLRALSPEVPANLSFGATVVEIGKRHLKEHPREAGGDNLGPWVRLYMDGNEGPAWFWCAGFVTFLMKQAAEILGKAAPIDGSFSCDTLAAQGKEHGIYLSEAQAKPQKITSGAIFLVRRTPGDWTHCGIVDRADAATYSTLEGNTNDDGSRNGYEVCTRKRGYGSKDFVLL